jgi:hypothetical protein
LNFENIQRERFAQKSLKLKNNLEKGENERFLLQIHLLLRVLKL